MESKRLVMHSAARKARSSAFLGFHSSSVLAQNEDENGVPGPIKLHLLKKDVWGKGNGFLYYSIACQSAYWEVMRGQTKDWTCPQCGFYNFASRQALAATFWNLECSVLAGVQELLGTESDIASEEGPLTTVLLGGSLVGTGQSHSASSLHVPRSYRQALLHVRGSQRRCAHWPAALVKRRRRYAGTAAECP